MDEFSFSGAFDSFTQLANGYFGMRTAEAQADATGQGQAQLNGQVEQQTGVGQVPLQANQYQAVGSQVGGKAVANSPSGLPFGLTQNQLVIGGALLAALLIFKN